MDIAVAVSGGIDSLCALLLLRQQGYTPLAIYGRFLPSDTLPDAYQDYLATLRIPLTILDLTIPFAQTVLAQTQASLNAGKTPNPCALCNKSIKFGLLANEALALHTPFATGHYVQTSLYQDVLLLTKAKDTKKDQSYFLSLIPKALLPHLRFPLAQMTKEECRALLSHRGLPQPKESQDVCFRLAPPFNPGRCLLIERDGSCKEVAPHNGLANYTLGQRRGLGISYREGLYVVKKDYATNTLYVGPLPLLGMRGCTASSINYFLAPASWPKDLFAKVRYRQKAVPMTLVHADANTITIAFDQPQFPSDLDQILSVSDRDGRILAGGVVDGMELVVDSLLR
ncbi:MAG: tRNA-specific 2-thiouridylase [Desulfovibrio sp.]|nr:tRNA-specific 2-thiouridylase [Desulfovibrio sp.]